MVKVGNPEFGPFNSFLEAFRKFHEEVLKMVKEGTSYQVLETFCWIECEGRGPIFIYEIGDAAYSLGLMDEKGKLIDGVEVSEEEVAKIFGVAFVDHQLSQINRMKEDLSTITELVEQLPDCEEKNEILNHNTEFLNELTKEEKTLQEKQQDIGG
jgi:Asp-tRNA(Asn)/Glu-tRNA(Gln) amidotransferase C subunit